MGKRSRSRRLNPDATGVRTPTTGKENTPLRRPAGRRPRGWRLVATLLVLGVLIPVVLITLLEAGLRLGGYGHSTAYFELMEDGRTLTTNPQFAWQFYSRETSTSPTPLLFPERKPPGAYRIIVLGESAAAGTPDPAFSFSRMLKLMLRRQYPSNQFEIINAAMRGVNSHIIRPIARESARLSPDLFIVYMGNNELIGLHAPSPEGFNFTAYPRLLRLGDAFKGTRLAQFLRALQQFGPGKQRKPQDMDYLRRQRLAFDDVRRQGACKNFQGNLEEICDTTRRSGAATILATVAVNLRDFPPMASLHRRGLTPAQQGEFEAAHARGADAESQGRTNEALAHFQTALRLDDHFAELHYRLARNYESAGQSNLCRQHYALAGDWDALQFRADGRINEIIRQTAANRSAGGVFLADVAGAFSESPLADNGVPGERLFHDHVHFTFDGDYLVARSLLPTIATALRLGPANTDPPVRDECARALAFTPVDEMNVLAAMAQQTSKPPFLDQLEHAQRQARAEARVRERLNRTTNQDFERAASVYAEAIARAPEDWMLRYNLGNLLSQFGRHADASAQYEFVVRRLPRQRVFRLNYGNALLQAGRTAEALAQYRAALEIDPDFAPAKEAIDSAQRRTR
jgi:tetratricopeptide (TPR) repeat protein